MARDYEDLLDISSPVNDGMPKGTDISNPTEKAALKREAIGRNLEAIEEAITTIPEEYRSGVWNNVVLDKPYPSYAVTRTWTTYKGRFLYALAENLNRI